MAESLTSNIIEKFLDENLNVAEEEQLALRASLDLETCGELTDQKNLHQLLNLLAEEQKNPDLFVALCMEQLSPVSINRTKIAVRPDQQRHRSKPRATQLLFPMIVAGFAVISFCCWSLANKFFIERDRAVGQESVDPGLPEGPQIELANADATADLQSNANAHEKTPGAHSESEEVRLPIHATSPSSVANSIPADRPIEHIAVNAPRSPTNNFEDRGQRVGKVISNRNANWRGAKPTELFRGQYRIESGSARLIFDNGTLIRLSGPAEFEIADGQNMKLIEGNLLVDVPGKNDLFKCTVADHNFSSPRNVAYFLSAGNDDSWECFLVRGSLGIANSSITTPILPMSKGNLRQALFRPSRSFGDDAPNILVAKGDVDFVGCCYSDSGLLTLPSPKMLQHLLNQVVENDRMTWGPFTSHLHELNAALDQSTDPISFQQFDNLLAQHLQRHFPEKNIQKQSDNHSGPSTQFHGSLNVNGEVHHFDSLDEFNHAKQLILQGRSLELLKQPEFDKANRSAQKPEFRIGNQTMRFSSPERFKQLKRNMNK